MGALDYLKTFGLDNPKADLWNAMVNELRRRLPRGFDMSGTGTSTLEHPFLTRVERWDEPPGIAKIDPARAWRVMVRAACVNDDPVTMLYERRDDKRGWLMPDDYPAPTPGEPGYHDQMVDRPLRDIDDPPFLPLESPPLQAESTASITATRWLRPAWIEIMEDARIPFFQTDEMMEKRVFRTSVILTAEPKIAQVYFPLAPTLRKFRVFAGKRPTETLAIYGGWLEVAQLFLTRDRGATDYDHDEVLVKQTVFYNVFTMVVQEAFQFPGGPQGDGGFGGIGIGLADDFAQRVDAASSLLTGINQAELDRINAEAAAVEFWSV